MARTAKAAAEFLEEEPLRRDMPFRVNARFLKNPDPGSKVILRGNFKAGFDTRQPEDQAAGWDEDHPMTLNADTFECVVNDLEVGKIYECKFFVIHPDSHEEWFPAGGPETNYKVKIEPETPSSPSPTTEVKKVRADLKRSVVNILEAGLSEEEIQSIEALFDQLRTEIDILGILDNLTLLFLELTVEAIREKKEIPQAIRSQFSANRPIQSFLELERCIAVGSRQYRQQVFNFLKANKAAREKFGLKSESSYNPRDPLGNTKLNEIFDRLCSARDLLALAPHLGVAINSVANVPARNAALDAQRRYLLNGVIARLTPEERREAAEPSKRAKLQEFGIQAGLVALGFVSPPIALLTWVAKGIIEGTAGVHISDIGPMTTKELVSRFLKNNVVTQWWKTQETLGDITKKGIVDWLKRSIPVFGAKYAGKDLPEAQAETAETGHPEALIRAACEKAAA